MKILDVRWFCGATNVGIACIDEHDNGEYRYVISAIPGVDKKSDALYVAEYGGSFDKSAGDVLFGKVK